MEFRARELVFAGSHLQRLAWNTPESIETRSLHLDLISEMKRINSHPCSVAYPILESAGVLSPSRLRAEPEPQRRRRKPRALAVEKTAFEPDANSAAPKPQS